MSQKPLILVQVDDLARHVQSTMRRAPVPLGESVIAMTGGLIMHCMRMHIAGHYAHPGRAKMAAMGRCSDRQAKRNISQLRNWLVMVPVADEGGGRRATRYRLDLLGLKRALVTLECNPSPELIEKIEAVFDVLRGDMRGDMRGDTMSPGIYSNKRCANSRSKKAKLMLVGGTHE